MEEQRTPPEDVERDEAQLPVEGVPVAAQTPQGPAGSALLGLLPSKRSVFLIMLRAMAPWCPGELLEGCAWAGDTREGLPAGGAAKKPSQT